MDVPQARTPRASLRSPRRLCARKPSSTGGPRRSRRLGPCPIRCAVRCRYFLVAHRVADRAAVKPLRESWPRSWAVNSRPLREPCTENPHPRSPPPQINRGSGTNLFPPFAFSSLLPCLLVLLALQCPQRRSHRRRIPTRRRRPSPSPRSKQALAAARCGTAVSSSSPLPLFLCAD